MMAREFVEKVAAQATGFFEKATEMRFFVHLLCLLSYLELGLFVSTGKALHALTWDDFEHLSPGVVGLLVLGYFFLMGYIFRLVYAVFSWLVALLDSELGPTRKTGWGGIFGMVHKNDVLKKAYESTGQHDLTRMLEAQQKDCRRDAKEFRELGYVSFAALLLVLWNYWFVTEGMAARSDELFIGLGGSLLGHSISTLLLVPLAWVVWAAITSDFDQENYLEHKPLYDEIEEQKRKEREKNGVQPPRRS